MERSVHGDGDGFETHRRGRPHGRAQCFGAQAPAAQNAPAALKAPATPKAAAASKARLVRKTAVSIRGMLSRSCGERRSAWRGRRDRGRAYNAVLAGRD